MSVITSLNCETHEKLNAQSIVQSEILVNKLLDEIVIRFSSLIADVEDHKVDENILKNEIGKLVDEQKGHFNLEAIKKSLFNTIYGYGDLQQYIDDPEISDIDASTFDYFTIKRKGVIEEIGFKFESESAFERFCKLLIIRNGGVINEIDNHCRVSDVKNHLRINVCISPRNTSGTSLTIRKHLQKSLSLDDLQALSMINRDSRALIDKMVYSKSSILICGKGGAGKTTLLRGIIEASHPHERILICESDVELMPKRKNCISQSIKKMHLGGKKITLNDLIRDGLTMSLDSYCIGELTGKEAWEFIKAGNTDHRILGTIHANNSEDTLLRLLTLIETETRLGENTLRLLIHESIQYIIYIADFKVVEIAELSVSGNVPAIRHIYRYKRLKEVAL
ncbi:ATPase, T2SS/T4P/T4SS family [Fusibacter ferrireducens]|uniref:CpaF family protein n=1 Tax=Fusibacter ferrireducens TaxID=2785058 RepID=A0ABR9ZZ75_9FIRM|nr:ATPase, T2SS/T4P/T4SS family [Fusibacter ferrireducens]MBF4695463.1 CpaF family protein [Fusibacter ferrireducens]